MGGEHQLPERYRPVRLLGEGAAGQVWLCRDKQAGDRQVAVKVLVAEQSDATGFRNEFATLSTLTHPNLPETYHFDQSSDGTYCFALEYIEGRTFCEAVHAEGFAVFPGLAAECLQAVSFIHDFGLIHRDLKPENLLVRRVAKNGCRLVMLDFGLVESRRKSEGETGGTLRYMAPELFEGKAPTNKTDLYALGVLFLEALIGQHAVNVDPSLDLAGYLEALKAPTDVRALPSNIPAGLVQWLNTLRSFEADDRPSDAREALAQLKGVVESGVSLETEATRAARIASGAPPGRSAELEAIQNVLTTDGTTTVFLMGEAGAGKTRVLDFVCADAIRRGWSITTLEDIMREADISGASKTITSRVEPNRLGVIDELENASPETSMLLDRLVRRPADNVTKLIASGRAEEINDPRLRALLSDARFIPTAVVVELEPLNAAGVAEVLERVDGTQPSDDRIRRLLEATDGLAAALEALVVRGEQSGDGISRLRESIRTRFDDLSIHSQRCLVALAAIGEPTDSELLGAVLATSQVQLFSSLDELSAARLAGNRGKNWEVRSRFINNSILAHADRSLVAKITRQSIDVIQNDSRMSDPAKLARLWRQHGDLPRAVEFAIRAAEKARNSGRPEVAAVWFVRAIVDLPRNDPRYGKLRLEHAKVSEQAEDFWSAAKSYAAAIRSTSPGSEKSSLLALQARSLVKSGRHKNALPVAEAARETATTTLQRCIADAVLGSILAVWADVERVTELVPPAAEWLDGMGEHRWAAEAFYTAAIVFERSRQLEAAVEGYRHSERYATTYQYFEVAVYSLISLANVYFLQDNPVAALEHLDRAQELTAKHNLGRQGIWIPANKGRVLELLGKRDLALASHEESGSGARLAGNIGHYAVTEVSAAENLIALGRPAQAKDRLLRLLDGPLEPTTNVFAKLTLAEALLQERDVSEAEVFAALSAAQDGSARLTLADWGFIVVSLEAHARFETRPPDDLWQRFENAVEEKRLDKQLLARGWLAWSKEKIRCSDWHMALKACAKALEALDGRHHDIAAQVYLSMSKANKIRAAHIKSNIALERGREELQKAANLIEDEELRNDFLARPLFRELREKRETFADAEERLGGLYDMVHALNTGGDPEDQLGVILDQALRVVRAERGLILLRSEGDDKYQVRFSRNLESQTIEEAAQFSRTAVLAAGKGESVLAINAANDERVRQMKSVSAYGIQSLLCVPLRVRDELVGAVYADSRADGALFNQQDLQFLEAFADHAALALENARGLRRLEQRRAQLLSATQSRESFGAIVGRSPGMQQVYDLIERVAESHLPVLIQGASGTGKELVAREIFARSLRKNKPFLSENCAAIAESLLESELFGHVKGAFTGAERDKEGLFEQAHGGTLFLDEVGDMSPAMQARLLRVLQDGELRRVGAETRRHVDVRLITATNRDLSQRVAEGKFREDLLYRLQVLVIQLPPLKDRPTDIGLLVRHFLDCIAKQRQKKKVAIRTDAMELLERYAWPGNVRQLENTLQRLALFADGAAISRATIEQDPSLQAALIGEAGQPTLSLKQNERDRIAEALKQASGNRADAAKLLGVSRATIFRKIKHYGLN